jgi:hypothetical protein
LRLRVNSKVLERKTWQKQKEIILETKNIKDQIIKKCNPLKIILFDSAGCEEYG